jgi:hypothetical protein
MRSISCALLLVSLASPLPAAASACPIGEIATEFADAYSTFAPIFSLYGEYADYLFDGSPMTVPEGLGTACDDFAVDLALVHVALMTQTESGGLASSVMIRLRAETDMFCGAYQPILEAIGSSSGVDPGAADEASDAGLFARIYGLNELLEDAFAETFDAIRDDEVRWCFAIAFSTRTLVNRDRVERLDESLDEILYGGPNRTDPPFAVPEEISDAMAALVALSGRDLEPDESDRARSLAAEIHAYFVPNAPPQVESEVESKPESEEE